MRGPTQHGPRTGWVFGVIALISLGGCMSSDAPWPEHGQGGLAEEMPTNIEPAITEEEFAKLKADVIFCGAEVDYLGRSALNDWYPALIHRLEMQQTLIERQFEGGFYFNTRKDLTRLQELLNIAKQTMQEIGKSEG